jgi:hypothetical protein
MHREQQNLLHVAFNKKIPSSDGERVYQKLVFKVFFDALSSAYPLFYAKVDKKEFEDAVYEFMQFGAKSIEMWQMPNEFRKFVKKEKKFRSLVYTDELMWFEWSEMKLVMKDYKTQLPQEFSFKNEYKLSKSCVVKKLKYKVFEQGSYDKKDEYCLLGFYDFINSRVIYREISLPLYLFLKKTDKKGVKKAIKSIVKMSEQSKKKVKKFFEDTLNELTTLQILRTT